MNENIGTPEANNSNERINHPDLQNNADFGSFFTRFFKVLLVHKWMFLIIMLIVILVVALYAFRQPLVYQSNYEVFYNETISQLSDDSNTPVIKSDFDKNYWLRAMKSQELMKMTLINSGLSYKATDLERMISVGVVDKRKEDRIPIFLVQISAKRREDIPIVIRAYIRALNDLLLQNQVHNSERLVSYLAGQINQNNLKLNQLDVQIVHEGGGITKSEIVDFDKIKTTIDDFRKDLLNARVNLASIMSARKRTENELKNLDGTIVNESAFSEPLKVQLMNLEVDLARSLTKNKEDHPSVKQIRDNIRQISIMLRDSLEQRLEIKSLIQNPLKSQLMSRLLELQITEVSEDTRVKSLEKVIAELELKTMPNSVNQDQQQQLRNREMIYLTIKQLNDRLIETQSMSHGSLSRFVFIDDPSSVFLANKSIWYYIILAVLLGLVLASLIVFLYDLLDDRILLVEDYEHFYDYPLLGVIRHYHINESSLIEPGLNYKTSTVSDIGALIVSLRHAIKYKSLKAFVISSPDRQEGKSLVSLKIASALATKKQKVLLVDMDFFSPKLTTRLYPEQSAGLSNFIAENMDISAIVVKTEIETLDFVCAGNAEGQKELFYNDIKLAEFIEWSKANYDVVLFDTPAAMYITDIVEFFDLMDSFIVVARLRKTTRRLLNKLFAILNTFKGKNINVIINDLFPENGKAYSNYSYSYGDYSNSSNSSNTADANSKSLVNKRNVIVAVIIVLLLSLSYYLVFNDNSISRLQENNTATSVLDTIANEHEEFSNDSSMLDYMDNGANQVKNHFIDSIIVKPDTKLTQISLDYYGDKSFWVYIYIVNKKVIQDSGKLEIGAKLYIPSPNEYDIDAKSVESIDNAIGIAKQLKFGL